MIISDALAQTGQQGAGDAIMSFVPIVLILIVFYLLLIRPQQKRQKAHQAKLLAIVKGDKVITGGGIHGEVTKSKDDILEVRIAKDVVISVARMMISDVVPKNPPPQNDNKQSGIFGNLFGSK